MDEKKVKNNKVINKYEGRIKQRMSYLASGLNKSLDNAPIVRASTGYSFGKATRPKKVKVNKQSPTVNIDELRTISAPKNSLSLLKSNQHLYRTIE